MTFFERKYELELERRVTEAADFAVQSFKNKIDEKGISNTGELKQSVDREVSKIATIIQAIVFMREYGEIHSKGTPPERIPFSEGKRVGGGGGKSKYIQGLYTYFRFKGKSEKEAMSFAFATATLHSRFGAPLGYFKRNGRGSQWIEEAIEEMEPTIRKILGGEEGSTDGGFVGLIRGEIRRFVDEQINSLAPIQIQL